MKPSRQAAIDEYNKLKAKGMIVFMPHGIVVPQQCHKIQDSPRFQLGLQCIEEAQVMQLQGGKLKEIGDTLVQVAKKKVMHQVKDYKERCEEYIDRLHTKDKVCCMCGHQYHNDEWKDGDDDCVITCSEACSSQRP